MPYSDPKFPVINPTPEVDDCLKAMRIRDWAVLAGVTSGSWGFGYLTGKPVRGPAAATAASIGFTFGTFLILQDTRGRLMGYKENAKEVKKLGLAKVQPPPDEPTDPRFPTATVPGMAVTRPTLEWKNYK